MIARNNSYGLDVRYGVNGEQAGEAVDILKGELKDIHEFSDEKIDTVFDLHSASVSGDDLIEVWLMDIDEISEDETILGKNEYIVALKDEYAVPGIAIPNYSAAATMGLSLAALRVAKDKANQWLIRQKEYEILRSEICNKFKVIYQRHEVTENYENFSEEELELMVTGKSGTKLYYTLLYALPPLIKVMEELHKYHELMREALRAA